MPLHRVILLQVATKMPLAMLKIDLDLMLTLYLDSFLRSMTYYNGWGIGVLQRNSQRPCRLWLQIMAVKTRR